MVLKLGHFGKWVINNWKVLKCGTSEGWRRSVGMKLHRNIVTTIKNKANSTCYILCSNGFLTHLIERQLGGRMEFMERRGRRSKQLLNDLQETTGY
jgi:hypothetical protein